MSCIIGIVLALWSAVEAKGKVVVSFAEPDVAVVNGSRYPVANRRDGYALRLAIGEPEVICFDGIDRIPIMDLWRIANYDNAGGPRPKEPEYKVRLPNGKELPLRFGPQAVYALHTRPAAIGMIVAVADLDDVREIDFSSMDSFGAKHEFFLELRCDMEKTHGRDVERLIEEFAEHGKGVHNVYLGMY